MNDSIAIDFVFNWMAPIVGFMSIFVIENATLFHLFCAFISSVKREFVSCLLIILWRRHHINHTALWIFDNFSSYLDCLKCICETFNAAFVCVVQDKWSNLPSSLFSCVQIYLDLIKYRERESERETWFTRKLKLFFVRKICAAFCIFCVVMELIW